jgi:hypothetical protein
MADMYVFLGDYCDALEGHDVLVAVNATLEGAQRECQIWQDNLYGVEPITLKWVGEQGHYKAATSTDYFHYEITKIRVDP